MLKSTLTAIVLVLTAAIPRAASFDKPVPPAVPPALAAPAGARLVAVTEAAGTQNYMCLPSGEGVAWVHLGPQATLFGSRDEQVMTHFLSGNPLEGDLPRATWQDSRDTSTVWAVAIASYTGSDYVQPGAIPWLLLRVVGAQYGPAWGDRLIRTTYIQRVNTVGGVAPADGCASGSDVGRRAFVPYTTAYVFYR
jgi:hypothetical protein